VETQFNIRVKPKIVKEEQTKMKNTQKISKITLKKDALVKCKLGEDWYTASLTLVMYPDDEIPDYRDVATFIEQEVSGKLMTIEDVMEAVATFIMTTYQPHFLSTVAEVSNSNHPYVLVERTDEKCTK
jgi:hypothetical protein